MSNLHKIPAHRVIDGGSRAIPLQELRRVQDPKAQAAQTDDMPQFQSPELARRWELLRAREAEVEALCAMKLQSAEEQANAMLSAAQARVAEITAQAEQEGYRRGYSDGFAAGEQAAHEAYAARIEEARAMAERLNEQRVRWVQQLKDCLVPLVMEAVRRVLYRELMLAPTDVATEVESLLEYVAAVGRVEVRVHPGAFLAATEAQPKWRSAKFGDWEIIVIPDDSIQPGGCEIRSPSGRVDARLETKLEVLEQVLAALAADGGFVNERVLTG